MMTMKISSAKTTSTELVTQAVGQVDTHVITSREVQISWILDKAMQVPTGKKTVSMTERSAWLLPAMGAEFQHHLSQVLLEWVVSKEAENFSIAQVSADDVRTSMAHVKELTAAWPFWKTLEVSSAELEQMMTRKLKARNFLKFKTETSGVRISEREVKEYYDKNRLKFGNTPLEQVKGQIREYLSREQTQGRLKDWFEILKRKYRVKLLGT
jgi:hypothetical protein